jgi:YidC/Oxa1 family membrane protein insertase
MSSFLASLTNGLIAFLSFLFVLTGNLGLAIIVFTLLVRAVLLPLTLPSLRAANRMKELQPEVKELKTKFGKDKKGFQQAQMELYKKYNVNPLAGCLPQLLQLAILIFLYQAMMAFLNDPQANGLAIDPSFLWLDLRVPDALYILPVVTALTQLVHSVMIAPGAEKRDIVPNKSKKKVVQEENKKEEDFAEMAAGMQQQMLYILPVFTGVIALQFPSGLVLYWVTTTVFGIAQQYYLSGWGGLAIYSRRLLTLLNINTK